MNSSPGDLKVDVIAESNGRRIILQVFQVEPGSKVDGTGETPPAIAYGYWVSRHFGNGSPTFSPKGLPLFRAEHRAECLTPRHPFA